MTEARATAAAAPRRRLSPGDVGAISAAAALLAATALTGPSEGYKARPYWDPAHIRSYCFGETSHVVERTYSRRECEILLDRRLSRDYAPKVAACAPEILADDRIKIFAALTDAAYNAGSGAVCNSPMVARIHAGDVAGAIDAFTAKGSIGGVLPTHGWFTTATYRGPVKPASAMLSHGWTWAAGKWRKELPGLVCRRKKEAAIAAGLDPERVCQ